MKTSQILITEPSVDYELIHSGEGEKLERFGKYVLSRPDPQALWHKKLGVAEWKKADGHFSRSEAGSLEIGDRRGDWKLKKDLPDRWNIELAGLKFYIKPTTFKHVGLFPEQSTNWNWLRERVKSVAKPEETEVLNLFGYTGAASLASAQAGAKVVHVDGSKAALTWANENAELSGLKDKPIRWILDDARAFVKREIKRGRLYDGIIMDPPAFGHGPENELWKIEEHFLPLLDDCMKLLKPQPLFLLINGYSAGYSAIAYENSLLPLQAKLGGSIEIGELTIKESGDSPRLLPAGIFARWSK
jgi:23S rRNA (cytosine1962-C5)-methyltransferase